MLTRMIPYLKKLSYLQLLFLAAAISFIFSFVASLPNNPVNVDGLRYVSAAQAFAEHGVKGAFTSYPWPFFSILGALVHQLTGLSLLTSFSSLNALFQAVIVMSFIMLTKQLGGSTNAQRWAAAIILIYPMLNSIRDYATRDSGYWAFGLLAIYFFIQFLQNPTTRAAFLWALSMCIASLFRLEGLIMLCLTPFSLWFISKPSFLAKGKLFLKANSVLALLVLVSAIIYGCYSHHLSTDTNSNRLLEFRDQFAQVIPHLWLKLNTDASKISHAVLDEAAHENGRLILIGGLIFIYAYTLIYVMKFLYLALAVYGQHKSLIKNFHGEIDCLYFLLVINGAMLLIFLLERYFIATRYPIFMILIWMLWIPFALEKIYITWKNKPNSKIGGSWLFPTLLAILFIMLISGLVRFGYSKSYITESGQWLYTHTAPTDKIFTNSPEVAFYASHQYEDATKLHAITQVDGLILPAKTPYFQWIALRINYNDSLSPPLRDFMKHHSPVQVFQNKRHDRVIIFGFQ